MSETPASYEGRVKYDEATARKYQVRKESKHLAEMRLIDRAFALVPKHHRVLDVPCGGGRASLHLARQCYAVSAADLSAAMLEITRMRMAEEGLNVTVEKQDVEALTLADRSFDTILSFRLFHHFPNPEIRRRVAGELCRVSRKYVALSYFSPASFTSVKRDLKRWLGLKKSEKHATSLAEVRSYFEANGFALVKDFAQLPFIHTMHLALFERVGETRP